MRLWQAARIAHGSGNRAIYRIPFEPNANLRAQSIRVPTMNETGLSLTHKRARQALDVPDKFDTAGPVARVHLLAAVAITREIFSAFSPPGARRM